MTGGQPALGPGELLPPFMLRSLDGRMVRRADYRGRRHLVICAIPDAGDERYRPLLDALAAMHGAIRAAGAEALALTGMDAAGPETGAPTWPFPILLDRDWGIGRRLGAMTASGERTTALAVADRYGEIALTAIGAAPPAGEPAHDLPFDAVVPTLEVLEARCSL